MKILSFKETAERIEISDKLIKNQAEIIEKLIEKTSLQDELIKKYESTIYVYEKIAQLNREKADEDK